jgi:hypothetical protein
MRWVSIIEVITAASLATGLCSHSSAAETVSSQLRGFKVVPPVFTKGTGEFQATIIDKTSLEFELIYTDLEGRVQQASIHFGQLGVNGGILVFLCSNMKNAPAGVQECPETPGTVTGVISPGDVILGSCRPRPRPAVQTLDVEPIEAR